MKTIVLILTVMLYTFNSFSQISEFEHIFGDKNVQRLNTLLENCETTILKKQFPNLDTKAAYMALLDNVSVDKMDFQTHVTEDTKALMTITAGDNSFNLSDLYTKALELTPEKTDYVDQYLIYASSGMPISPKTIARSILRNDADLNDYYVKRLIVVNIVYK